MMIASRTATTFAPPVMEARRWLDGVTFTKDRPLINLSQAAPVNPPPEPLRRAIAEVALNEPEAHLYGPVLGLPELRAEIASQWTSAYGGTVRAEQVCITSGCNQAFTAAIDTLCTDGDEVILPIPYYFNHRMWLDMSGVTTVCLPTRAGLIPDAEDAAALITARTKAIVLVSPNNPAGVEYPAETLRAFYDLCKERGIALIVVTVLIGGFSFFLAPLMGGGEGSLYLFVTLGMFLMGLTYGVIGAALAAPFPTRVRYTGSSITFNFAGIFGASLAPYAATWLQQNHGLTHVGYYMGAAAVITLLCILASGREEV